MAGFFGLSWTSAVNIGSLSLYLAVSDPQPHRKRNPSQRRGRRFSSNRPKGSAGRHLMRWKRLFCYLTFLSPFDSVFKRVLRCLYHSALAASQKQFREWRESIIKVRQVERKRVKVNHCHYTFMKQQSLNALQGEIFCPPLWSSRWCKAREKALSCWSTSEPTLDWCAVSCWQVVVCVEAKSD